MVNSLISLYYYMMVMKQMYMMPAAESSPLSVSMLNRGVLGAMLAGIIIVGIYPGPLVGAIEAATKAILP